jgi:DNA repair exonuclease SbcCD ATPase subunit
MIFFKSIKFKNFISTGNYWTQINFDRSTNTLVVGTNGAGKSTMLDALCFVLFGKAFRNINKPQLVNSINQKDCVVEIELAIGTKQYRIVRGIKPNIFEIYQDGELLNQDAANKDYQEHLEKFILKLNYKSFTQIVILGSASFTPFMQLSASDRRAIIEDLLDIQIFSTMNSVLKDKLVLNKESIGYNKTQYELVETKHEMQDNHIAALKQNNDDMISAKQNEITNTLTHIETTQKNIDALNEEVISLQTSIDDTSLVDGKIKKLNQLETQIETNLSKYKKDLKFFQHSDDCPTCPTCHQNIPQEFKQEQIADLNVKIIDRETGLNNIEKLILEQQSRLNEIQSITRQIQLRQVNVASNNMSIVESNKYIGKLQKEIKQLSETKEDLSLETGKLLALKKQLQELEASKKELIEEKTYLDAASLLLKDTGIKTKIIKQYLPIINKLVNKYLASLDFFVNFNLDESFKETIKSRHRDEFSYASFSEGEKQRIDMALMLTWRAVAKLKNSTNTNLLILDEVFDSSLDNNGTEYLMSILQMLEDVNLFVISHKGDILQDKFRSVLRFEKVNNFSRIVA